MIEELLNDHETVIKELRSTITSIEEDTEYRFSRFFKGTITITRI